MILLPRPSRRALGAVAIALLLAGCGSGRPGGVPHITGDRPPAPAPGPTEGELRSALALHPDDAATLARLSKLLWETRRHEEAIALLEERRAAAGRLPDELALSLALHYEAIDRVDLADGIVRSLDGRFSQWDTAGAALTYLQLRGDDFLESAGPAARALAARPNSAVNQNNWGITQLYAGRPVEARKAFLTAVELDPTLPGPLYNLAIVDKFYRFDDASAREWFRRYTDLADEDPDGLADALAVRISADTSSAPDPAGAALPEESR
jgi:Flp pilus assembly protein TadD